jgi:hypothetical protein
MHGIPIMLASLIALVPAAGPERTMEVSRHAWRTVFVSIHASREHGVEVFAHKDSNKVFMLLAPAEVNAWITNAFSIVDAQPTVRHGETRELVSRHLFDADYSSISVTRRFDGSTSTFRVYIASRGSIGRMLATVSERELREFLSSLKQAVAAVRQLRK